MGDPWLRVPLIVSRKIINKEINCKRIKIFVTDPRYSREIITYIMIVHQNFVKKIDCISAYQMMVFVVNEAFPTLFRVPIK